NRIVPARWSPSTNRRLSSLSSIGRRPAKPNRLPHRAGTTGWGTAPSHLDGNPLRGSIRGPVNAKRLLSNQPPVGVLVGSSNQNHIVGHRRQQGNRPFTLQTCRVETRLSGVQIAVPPVDLEGPLILAQVAASRGDGNVLRVVGPHPQPEPDRKALA